MQNCRVSSCRLPRTIKQVPLKPTNPQQTRTMAFFPRTLYNTEASFTPLFRLLEDFDSYSRQGSQCGSNTNNVTSRRSAALSHFQPKFDVRETGENYELHGELPGLSKEDINIEFTEPQTLVVRGKVERSYTSGTHPSAATQAEDAPKQDAEAEDSEETAAKAHSHQASVADEDENNAQENGFEVVEEPQAPIEPKKPADQAKYWLSERSIGEFSRSFSFPSRVDQDSVSAGFKDGILSIVVPKAKKHESRRIAVL